MIKLKEILTEGWDVYPKWLWALNGLVIAMALLVIIFV
jgi:hypothetical protein